MILLLTLTAPCLKIYADILSWNVLASQEAVSAYASASGSSTEATTPEAWVLLYECNSLGLLAVLQQASKCTCQQAESTCLTRRSALRGLASTALGLKGSLCICWLAHKPYL